MTSGTYAQARNKQEEEEEEDPRTDLSSNGTLPSRNDVSFILRRSLDTKRRSFFFCGNGEEQQDWRIGGGGAGGGLKEEVT